MEVIEGCKDREIVGYTLEEARAEGWTVIHWRSAEGPGWVLTDDGYVVQCSEVKTYREPPHRRKVPRVHRIVATALGRHWASGKNLLLWHRERERINNSKPVRWQEVEARRTRTRNMVKVYAVMLLGGRVDHHVLGVLWRPDQIVPAASVKRLLRQEEIVQMVSRELFALMKSKGVSPEYVVEKMMRAVDIAELRQDAGNILRACQDFRGMLGMEHAKGMLPAGVEQPREAQYEDVLLKAEEEMRSAEQGKVQRALLPCDGGNSGLMVPGTNDESAPAKVLESVQNGV